MVDKHSTMFIMYELRQNQCFFMSLFMRVYTLSSSSFTLISLEIEKLDKELIKTVLICTFKKYGQYVGILGKRVSN